MRFRNLAVVCAALICAQLTAHAAPRAARASAGARRLAPQALGVRPTYFEPNVGQASAVAKFVARGRGYAAFLADGGPTFAFYDPNAKATDALRIGFANSRSVARATPERELPGKVNYLVGNDRSTWRLGVPTYAAVRYADLYDGVDAVFYGSGDALEYDFVVAPGADASRVALRFEGQRSLSVDEDGTLRVELSGGELRQFRPAVYQEGATSKRVSARYAIDASGVVRFDVGEYDRTRPLVIDPVLVFTAFVSGTDVFGTEEGRGVAADATGATYFVGRSPTLNFPVTPGAYDTTGGGNLDAFVAKFDPTGTQLEFATYLGGAVTAENAYDVAVGATGAVYVAGLVGLSGPPASADFPVTAGAYQTTYGGGFYDAFVAKLDATGSSLLYATYLGRRSNDILAGIALDASGRAVVVGHLEGSQYEFPTTAGAYDTTPDGGHDLFVAELSADGGALAFSTLLGGSGNDDGADVAVDDSGAVYVVGYTGSPDYPTTPGALQTAAGGVGDAFVTKLAADGSALVYSTFLAGELTDDAQGVAVGPDGSCYVTGETGSVAFPTTPGALDATLGGTYDGFVSKVNPQGSALDFSTYLGGAQGDIGRAIAVDGSGFVYVAGTTGSADFPITPDGFDTTIADTADGFVTILSENGSQAVYGSFVGGAGTDTVLALAVDASATIHIGGTTNSSDFAQTGFGMHDSTRPFVLVLHGISGDSPGVYIPASGAWFLKNASVAGAADAVFTYGGGGSALVPLRGDWDGDGVDTPGLYDPGSGAFFLRNDSSPGPADLLFTFGAGGMSVVPVTGDFDGDGTDSVGIYVRSTGTFFLKNSNTSGVADLVFTFGAGGPGVEPIFGDWNGDGIDTPALYVVSNGTYFLKNANASGNADLAFAFGAGGALPLAGDWDGDGTDSVGLYYAQSGVWFLKNANAGGPADLAFSYGPSAAVPLVGDWDGQ